MPQSTDSLAANKQLVLDYFHDVVASFDLRPLSRFIADDFILHGADDLVGIDAFASILERDFDGKPPLDPADVRMFPPAFLVAEDDLVTIAFYMPMREPGTADDSYDYFGLNTYRVRDGKIAERWTNEHRYARPQFLPEMAAGKSPTAPGRIGETDLQANKDLVARFYAEVFGPMNVDAVKDFVSEDYLQHVSHMPQGRAGVERFVADLAAAAPAVPSDAPAPEGALPAPAVLHAEGDMVVIAAEIPQPLRDGSGGTWNYFAYDVYRIREGKLAEHWSGIDKHARPEHG